MPRGLLIFVHMALAYVLGRDRRSYFADNEIWEACMRALDKIAVASLAP